jgi:hypothetical protein
MKRTRRKHGTCWLSSTSSASPPLRTEWALLRGAGIALICLWGGGTVLGTGGDVLIGPGGNVHTHSYLMVKSSVIGILPELFLPVLSCWHMEASILF